MTDILLVEDNIELGTVLCDFLKAEGYTFYHATSGEDGLSFMKSDLVKIVLLDIMLPGMDGFGVCSTIREQSNIPIMMISAKLSKEDKLNGLLLGADDYIEKPYDIDILLAKISGIYKRYYVKEAQGKIVVEGDIRIDIESRTVYLRNQLLNLTIKEYDLLLLFLENRGKVLKKEWIFNQIWGVDSFSESSTLTVHIKWLREKIELDSKKPEHIITIWGVGYKFV